MTGELAGVRGNVRLLQPLASSLTDTDHSLFRSLLRSFRHSAGLTQDELAERADMSGRGVRMLESGERRLPRLETVRRLAEALQLDAEDTRALLHAARPEASDRKSPVGDAAFSRESPPPGNIPAQITPLIGRTTIVDEITNRLTSGTTRLLTITGPPGIGKTRVAIEVAREIASAFPQGVFGVWLASVGDASLVLPQIYVVVGGSAQQREITPAMVADLIGDARMLLVLDNMEHLLPAAEAIPQLLGSCPNLKVLATSRSRLRVTGEELLPLPPLGLPNCDDRRLAIVARSEAEELFLTRARSADPSFQPNPMVNAQVADICRRLDGLPLAIELAAGQLSEHSITDIAARAERMLPILKDGPRDQPGRLQTMTQSLAWSYSLLSPDQQRLLRRLSVFQGGFMMDAAWAVDAAEDRGRDAAHSGSTEENLRALIERSLVVRPDGRAPEPRYSLLELIREYAGELLDESGEAEAIRDAHAAWLTMIAAEHERYTWIPRDLAMLERIVAELPNIRAALAWLEASGDGERMLTMAGRLRGFWTSFTHLREGQRWLERALALESSASPLARSKGRLAFGQLRFYLGDDEGASADYEVALEEALASGDAFQIACASSSNAAITVFQGDYAKSLVLCDKTLEAAGQIDDRELGKAIAIWTPGARARAEHGLGNLKRADEHFQDAARLMKEFEQPRGAARVLSAWGTLAVDQYELSLAMERFIEGASLAYGAGDEVFTAINIRMIAAVRAIQGDVHRAARLMGAAQAMVRSTGLQGSLSAMDVRVQEEAERLLRRALGNEELAQALEAGARLSLAEALAEAQSLAVAGSQRSSRKLTPDARSSAA